MTIREGSGNPLHYSCLENPVGRGAWWAVVHGSQRVSHDWSDLACMHALEMQMASHSSVLAWRIPGTEKPVGLPSMGSHRVGHDWSDTAAAAAAFNCLHAKPLQSSLTFCNQRDCSPPCASVHGILQASILKWVPMSSSSGSSSRCYIYVIKSIYILTYGLYNK